MCFWCIRLTFSFFKVAWEKFTFSNKAVFCTKFIYYLYKTFKVIIHSFIYSSSNSLYQFSAFIYFWSHEKRPNKIIVIQTFFAYSLQSKHTSICRYKKKNIFWVSANKSFSGTKIPQVKKGYLTFIVPTKLNNQPRP